MRLLIDQDRKDVRHAQGARLLRKDLPSDAGMAPDAYYWFFGTYSLRLHEGDGGEAWTAWKERLLDLLLRTQNREGEKKGSWEALDRWSPEAGRIYITALNSMTLNMLSR